MDVTPVHEIAARYHLRPSVAARIAKFQPDGIKPGYIVRGLYRKPLSWRRAKKMLQAGREPRGPFRLPDGKVHEWFRHGPYRGPHLVRQS